MVGSTGGDLAPARVRGAADFGWPERIGPVVRVAGQTARGLMAPQEPEDVVWESLDRHRKRYNDLDLLAALDLQQDESGDAAVGEALAEELLFRDRIIADIIHQQEMTAAIRCAAVADLAARFAQGLDSATVGFQTALSMAAAEQRSEADAAMAICVDGLSDGDALMVADTCNCIVDDGFGVSWQAAQMKVKLPDNLEEYAFRDEDDFEPEPEKEEEEEEVDSSDDDKEKTRNLDHGPEEANPWAVEGVPTALLETGLCAICLNDAPINHLACEHVMCSPCMRKFYLSALGDPTLLPCSCCDEPLDHKYARECLDTTEYLTYLERCEERSTSRAVYCPR